jgi:hypothetical protein
MAGINDYSNTAGSNTTINGIDIAEGCSPAGINNAIRQLMADIADIDDGVVPLQTPDINGGTIDGAIIGGTTPAAGTFTTITTTGDINFGDNDKANFGASNELQIYKATGGNSYIQETGTSNLRICGTEVFLRDGADTENLAVFRTNGASELYYDNSQKLATTSTGVNVTGTVVSDGLTVDGNASLTTSGANGLVINERTDSAGNSANIFLSDSSGTVGIQSSSGAFRFNTGATVGSASGTERLRINSSELVINDASNDYDFRVESDTNANALFVQGSDGHVGVGTGTLPRTLNIYGASNGTIGLDNPVSGSPQIAFKQNGTDKAFVTYWDAFDTLALSDGSGNGLHFKPSTGNVGIGASSPSAKLEVNGDVLIPEATLTDGATISWDVSTKSVAKVTLGGNRTLSAPSNSAGAGQFVSLLVIQDGTGSRTLTWNAVYEFASDTAPTLTTTGGKGDLFVFRYNGTKWLEVGRNLNLSLS